MKKILLSLFGIITLGLINFGSCENISYVNTTEVGFFGGQIFYLTNSEPFSLVLENTGTSYNCGNFKYSCELTPLDIINFNFESFVLLLDNHSPIATIGKQTILNAYSNGTSVVFSGTFRDIRSSWCVPNVGYSTHSLGVFINNSGLEDSSNSESYFNSSLYCSLYSDSIFSSSSVIPSSVVNSGYCVDNNLCSSSSSQCENDLQTCQFDLSTATGNLSQCQSDLATCQNSSSSCPTIDTQYCMINGLCPSGGGGECIEGSGFSDIYIYSNNRYFPITGTNSVFVNLPDYLNYSYDYSNGGDDLDIDIGYSVDNSYIEDINTQQSYIPTTEDFTNVFGNIGTFGALLVVCLFVILVFYMIKKIFS